ncbi:MAG: hypothetical protein JWQ87_988 [Candidatus Sulfotelmatobacter sp.]|nr:hypothetical protein [Candidatus Sulfotelmatobacter sp.]
MFKPNFDEYTRRARYLPMLIVLMPCTLPAIVLVARFSTWVSALVGPLIALGLPYWLAQTGRDRGKRKEAELYALWGGKPSTVKLRHRDTTINDHTKARYHTTARALLPTVGFPSPAEETADPVAADSAYEAFGDLLRERTRDSKKYRLVFEELMNYGFRRNLWGWKAAGIALSTTVLVILSGLLIWSARMWTVPAALLDGAVGVDVGILSFWLFCANPPWVKIAADAYADRLLEASDNLAGGAHKQRTKAGGSIKATT